MKIDSPDPKPRESGDYRVDPTAGYGTPYADIWLDEKGELRLRWVNADDCDRLIRAAAAAKEQILRYTAQMTAPHGRGHLYQGTCQLCGKPEDDELHAEAAAAAEAKRPLDPPVITDREPDYVPAACRSHGGTAEPAACWECQGVTAPVITDSERTCDQANPATGAWCHRGGDHGVHRDTNGDQWRTS